VLEENNSKPRLLYPEKLSWIKTFHDKQKAKRILDHYQHYRRHLKEFYRKKRKIKHNHKNKRNNKQIDKKK
jgi:hypothetical protein